MKRPENIAAHLATINEHNQRVAQIKASLDIKAQGVMAGFLHEQADIVLQSPHSMYLSIRSFFGPPSTIIASNGQYVTSYDFTGQTGADPYQKFELHPSMFIVFMDFRLHPASIINLFMQKIPLDEAKNLQFRHTENQLEIRAELKDDWELYALYDTSLQKLDVMHVKNEKMNIEYQAKYMNFQTRSGILFPMSFVLSAKGNLHFVKLQIEFTHIELNGQLVLPDVFYVRPH